jgi:hypothetical protein
MRVAIALGLVLIGSSTALAQDAAPDASHSPGFVTIERFDSVSRAGLDVSYVNVNTSQDVTLLASNLHGQYITPSGAGGYLQLPVSYATGSGIGTTDSVTALGDLELGGIYVTPIGRHKLALHAGLTLPTASDDLDKYATSIIGLIGSRLTDFYDALPKGTSIRLGASPLIRSGQLFARIDFGIDANLDNSGSSSFDSFLHFNGGLGFDLGTAAIMGEITNLYSTSNNGGWLNTVALSARFKAGDISPYAALIIPLDDDTQQFVDLSFTGGLELMLH